MRTTLLVICFWRAAFVHASAPATSELMAVAPTLLSAEVHSTLEAALWASSPAEGRALSAQLARLLRWKGDIRRLVQPGDQVSLLFEPAVAGQEPVLQAASYRGRGVQLEAFRFVGEDGIARHYDGDGLRIEPVMRNPPVPRYEQITELMQRGPGRRRHQGNDLKAPIGTPVVLPYAGIVTRTNWHRRKNGLCVEVRTDAGYLAHFLHLSQLEPNVRRGARLEAGAPLGEVGSTGRSNGPHLHYELLRGRKPLEPMTVHGRGQEQLTGATLTRFLSLRDALRRQIQGPQARPRTATQRP